jgi:hypothetical protein
MTKKTPLLSAILCSHVLLVITVGLVLVVVLPEAEVKADFVRFLAWKKARPDRILVERQVADLKSGFDQYFLEEYEVPSNRRVSRLELAVAARRTWLPTGQHEKYMVEMESDRRNATEKFTKGGYQPVCELTGKNRSAQSEWSFNAGGKTLRLLIRSDRKRADIALLSGKKEYSLMRFSAALKDEQIARRSLRQVVSIHGGRIVAVVIRESVVPSPQFMARDVFYFYPMKRAGPSLGVGYPIGNLKCGASGEP